MDDVVKVFSGALVLANIIGLVVGIWVLKWREQQAAATREALEAKDRLLVTLRDEQKADRVEIAELSRRLQMAERDLMTVTRQMFQQEAHLRACETALRLHKVPLPEEER